MSGIVRTETRAADAVKAATTLTELMRRRAALTPDLPYFHLYGDTVTYGRFWAQNRACASVSWTDTPSYILRIAVVARRSVRPCAR